MKRKSVHKSAVKSTKHSRVSKKGLNRGALGAGTAWALMGMAVIALGGTAMLGSIVPQGRESDQGQPVVLISPQLDPAKNNLQLETFPGVTFTPTPTPTVPPPPKTDSPQGGSSGSTGGSGGSGGGSGSGGSCFPAGTQVAMADGQQKNIEDVAVGDTVLGWDGSKQVTETVLKTESPIRDHLYKLNFADGTVLQLTREHPLYTSQGWKSISPSATAEENPNLHVSVLRVGDKVLNSDGNYVAISSVEFKPGTVQTYNLKSVSGFNDYYAGGKLAHNKGSTPSRGNGGGGGSSGGGGGGGGGGGASSGGL
jgi:uncharacterized membrane protein YgcG